MTAPYQAYTGAYNYREPSAEVTLANGTLTVQQGYTVVGAQTGTTGTLMHIDLDPDYFRVQGFQPPVYLKAAVGDTILVKNNADNIILKAGTDYVLTGEKMLHLSRFVATTNAVATSKWCQPD